MPGARDEAGKGRGAVKLGAGSSGRSAVAAEMLPTPPPPPPPCPMPRRGELTRAAGGRNPRLCRAPPEEHEEEGEEGARGRAGRPTDRLRGSRAGVNGALRGGATAARRPRRTVLLRGHPRRTRGAALQLSWFRVGQERHTQDARHPNCKPGLRAGPLRRVNA